MPAIVALVERRVQIVGATREALARELRGQYEAGRSFREIAEATGRSYGFVRNVIGESGAILRKRGGSRSRLGRARISRTEF